MCLLLSIHVVRIMCVLVSVYVVFRVMCVLLSVYFVVRVNEPGKISTEFFGVLGFYAA
jgi:hypothetical protein